MDGLKVHSFLVWLYSFRLSFIRFEQNIQNSSAILFAYLLEMQISGCWVCWSIFTKEAKFFALVGLPFSDPFSTPKMTRMIPWRVSTEAVTLFYTFVSTVKRRHSLMRSLDSSLKLRPAPESIFISIRIFLNWSHEIRLRRGAFSTESEATAV